MDDASKELCGYDDADLAELPMDTAYRLAEVLGVKDNGFEDANDLRDRLKLLKCKMQNRGHKPLPQFSRVQADAANKRRTLLELLGDIKSIFTKGRAEEGTSPLIAPLSEVLLEERLLSKENLLEELTDRMRALQARETNIIVAGETNSGKSTFLNVLLGQNILPTHVLHCTYVICKIVYSHSYSIETLDYRGHCEEYYCDDCAETNEKLKGMVACDNNKQRQESSRFKEITLKMPAEILKSGITLVDTPGIGENDAMDGVTINFVRESQASAFIYVIKSDGAGGVQEDRLVSFLRAVRENYKNDRLEGTFDPQAAMFVCHRWDTINPAETDKVRRNALTRLEMVWPRFHASQTFCFSSKKTKLHFDEDPAFITDSFNDLLKGLKHLIDRATHNVIKYQYYWIKAFLQPACRNLLSMITHCMKNNENLEDDFRQIALKQDHLLRESNDRLPLLREKLNGQRQMLGTKICEILSLDDVLYLSSEIEDYYDLLSACSVNGFLNNRDEVELVDQGIIAAIIKYCDDYLLRADILKEVEEVILEEIKLHIGLFEHQMKKIKHDMLGTEFKRTRSSSSINSFSRRPSLNSSSTSIHSMSSDVDDYDKSRIPDPMALNEEVVHFLTKRKKFGAVKKISKSALKFVKKISVVKGDHGLSSDQPKQYLDHRIQKLARQIRTDDSVINGFLNRYLHFCERCITHATNCIPQFIAVNVELMDKIREHREVFQEDKDFIKGVIEALEPFRSQLQGYGSLYMDDVNADQINFTVGRRTSVVHLDPNLSVSVRSNDDSGFIGSGNRSTKTSVRSFWAHFRNAKIAIDDKLEDVTIRTYSITMDRSLQYSEIAALRSLDNPNVAMFWGMTRIDSANSESTQLSPRVPCFIFRESLWSARVYMKNKLIDLRQFTARFLMELWHGLDYIHREQMVHMELNLDTVMVHSQTGEVKLCHQCKPREAQLPDNLSVKTSAAVCLSPSVLSGYIYTISDDIYAFGLLLWELLYPNCLPYREQRAWPLEEFIDKIHPSEMLGPDLKELPASVHVKNILNGCLISTRGIITMQDIYSFVRDINNDQAIMSLRNPRSRPLERRPGMLPVTQLSLPSEEVLEETGEENADPGQSLNLSLNAQSLPDSKDRRRPNLLKAMKNIATRRPPRPLRRSLFQAPDLSKLDIARHRKRVSLPNLPNLGMDEKCQRFIEDHGMPPKEIKRGCKGGEQIPVVFVEPPTEDLGASGAAESVQIDTGLESPRRGSPDRDIEMILRNGVSPLEPKNKATKTRPSSDVGVSQKFNSYESQGESGTSSRFSGLGQFSLPFRFHSTFNGQRPSSQDRELSSIFSRTGNDNSPDHSVFSNNQSTVYQRQNNIPSPPFIRSTTLQRRNNTTSPPFNQSTALQRQNDTPSPPVERSAAFQRRNSTPSPPFDQKDHPQGRLRRQVFTTTAGAFQSHSHEIRRNTEGDVMPVVTSHPKQKSVRRNTLPSTWEDEDSQASHNEEQCSGRKERSTDFPTFAFEVPSEKIEEDSDRLTVKRLASLHFSQDSTSDPELPAAGPRQSPNFPLLATSREDEECSSGYRSSIRSNSVSEQDEDELSKTTPESTHLSFSVQITSSSDQVAEETDNNLEMEDVPPEIDLDELSFSTH